MFGMEKTCTKCQQTKPLTEFYLRKSTTDKVRYHSRCKKCHVAQMLERYRVPEVSARRKEQGRIRRELNPDEMKNYHMNRRLKKFGLTLEQYHQLVEDQQGLCAICSQPPGQKGLVLDHCHVGGQFRALLCGRCNLAIGQFQDDVTILQSAIEYLQKHGVR